MHCYNIVLVDSTLNISIVFYQLNDLTKCNTLTIHLLQYRVLEGEEKFLL